MSSLFTLRRKPNNMLVGILTVLFSTTLGFPTRQQRLSLAEWGSYSFRDHKGPNTYAFGYDVEDPVTNNIQFRQEERHLNGSVTGSYGYVEPNGHVRIMHYIADGWGYRVSEENPSPVQLHPHHEVTTPAPIYEHDEPIFESEFHPVTENTYDDDYQGSTKPIQFPSVVQLPPPVHDHDYPRPQNQFSNDVSDSLFASPNHPFNKPLMPQRLVTEAIIYQKPGGIRGHLKFRPH